VLIDIVDVANGADDGVGARLDGSIRMLLKEIVITVSYAKCGLE
jgi:hypothetical protein